MKILYNTIIKFYNWELMPEKKERGKKEPDKDSVSRIKKERKKPRKG